MSLAGLGLSLVVTFSFIYLGQNFCRLALGNRFFMTLTESPRLRLICGEVT
jgi:hypothetical protein